MARNRDKRRCSARTADGGRCGSWAMRGSYQDGGRPLCNVHAGRMRTPDEAPGRACTAKKRDGSQCGNWALQGSDPPLCRVHANRVRIGLPEEEARRCTAVTKSGKRCRRWALRDGDGQRPLCNVHAGRHETRLPGAAERAAGRQCAALTAEGQRCRMWAMNGSEERYGRPLCMAHAGVRERSGRMPEAGEARCTAETAEGQRCQRWAVTEEPALCWVHAYPDEHGKIKHGYFRSKPMYGEREQAMIVALIDAGRPLEAEILRARLQIRELLAYLNQSALPLSQDLNAARLIFRGCGTVRRLVVARKRLLEEQEGGRPAR